MTEAWYPTLYTKPLSEDFITDGDRLLQAIDLAWQSTEHEEFELDEWQRWLIRAALERYPDDHPQHPGQLRYKEIVISMGRQNGKSVLGAIFAFYGLLLHTKGPEVVSIASTVPQANIIFDRVAHVFKNSRALRKRFKTTGTRGIRSITNAPGRYHVKAGDGDGLQGLPLSLVLADELHISKEAAWDAVVLGTSARRDGLVLGITTAGDESSTLLKRLYERGRAAAAGDGDERFGFFCWEAPPGASVTDPEAIKAANPAYACGRLDVNAAVRDAGNLPEHEARRYRLNQFVASESSWLASDLWNRLEVATLPHTDDVVFGIDKTEGWGDACITAAVRHEGRIYTAIVASIPAPTIDTLETYCVYLARRFPRARFVMEVANLKDLATRLKDRGLNAEYLTQTQMHNACAQVYALIARGTLVHAGDPLLAVQVPNGVAKAQGDGWRISRRHSVGDVDALLSTVMAVYYAETNRQKGPGIYIHKRSA